ncbi:unnamed protein product [Gongylonema pulchrum]|uniref:Secreted protein n=1 Tax=Gongylonema pulchrum TaxID=637853 RepID=A0A183DVG4_9BILA|nr:unnamed protein product [Gongylonema pulchrum]
MLGRRLTRQQWIALMLLSAGVTDIQIQYTPTKRIPQITEKPLLGFAAVLTMCFTSAFAGKFEIHCNWKMS